VNFIKPIEFDCSTNLHCVDFLSSCDFCIYQEEGKHFCLLHGVQIKNMDAVACGDFEGKDSVEALC
jgi:hypothetical protein